MKASDMIANVKAKFSNGVLVPLEPLDLEEGVEVTVSIKDTPQPSLNGESILDLFERLRKSVPSNTWDELPADSVKNKKHYLYGHPKETE